MRLLASVLAGLTAATSGASAAASSDHYRRAEDERLFKRDLIVVTTTEVVWETVTSTYYGDLPTLQAVPDVPVTSPATAPVNTPAADAVVVAAPTASTLTALANADSPAAAIPAPTTLASITTPAAVAVAPAAIIPADTPISVSPAASDPLPTTTTPIAVANPTTVATLPVSSAGDVSAGTYAGDGTFYELGLTACGQTYLDSDAVAAISYKLFDQNGTPNPNNNPHCGAKIRVFRGGKHVDVTVVDRCAGCEGAYDVDLSPSAFDQIASEIEGRVPVTWSYL
ncbi:hypothetical protein PYCC9005_004483 [Savitreella phatthalungensis]